MSLIDRLIEPTRDYIGFKDFLFHLSSLNDEPLYEVVIYLIHHNFGYIDFYDIGMDYKIVKFSTKDFDFDTVTDFLKEIRTVLSYSAEKWVWRTPNSIDELRLQDKRALTNIISNSMYSFFKISDLLNFEPLEGLLHMGDAASSKAIPKTFEPTPAVLPNSSQSMTLLYDYFTPHQACCFIAGLHPSFYGCDDDLAIAEGIIEGGLKSGKLRLDNDKQIHSTNLKEFLYSKNWILEGFNSYLLENDSSSTEKEISKESYDTIEQQKQEIADLKNQLAQAKAELTDKPAELKPLQGIAKHNAGKAYIISTSKALASYIWSMDTEKAIRTGDMVQQVRHVMHKVAPELLPDDKAIREWLSGIAPDYAKKAGKTPKDAPSEISLIMKK